MIPKIKDSMNSFCLLIFQIRVGVNVTTRAFSLEDLFYKYGVDLQFYAHEHSYERMWPVYKEKVTPQHYFLFLCDKNFETESKDLSQQNFFIYNARFLGVQWNRWTIRRSQGSRSNRHWIRSEFPSVFSLRDIVKTNILTFIFISGWYCSAVTLLVR